MIKVTMKRRQAARLALACAFLASPVCPARAESCPSIDAWLELIRQRGGQHRLLDAAELARITAFLDPPAGRPQQRWTSAIVTAFPDGSSLVLLAVNTAVCGVVQLPPNRWPEWRKTLRLS